MVADSKEEKIRGRLCPECGAAGRCYYVDVGGVDYVDEYTLHCPDCGKITRETKSGGSPIVPNVNFPPGLVTTCPFCGRTYSEHGATPKELQGYGDRFLAPKE